MKDLSQYLFEIRPLPSPEGGGYLITFPDFSECISDGETPEGKRSGGYRDPKGFTPESFIIWNQKTLRV